MRTDGSRLSTYNHVAKKACDSGKIYAKNKQAGSVSKLFNMSVLLLRDAKFKMDCSFSNQELSDKEIDFALKYIQYVV